MNIQLPTLIYKALLIKRNIGSLFQFQMPLDEIGRRVLWLSVWHSDMFGRNDFLGEVMLPMADQPLADQSPKWYSLCERVSHISNLCIFQVED